MSNIKIFSAGVKYPQKEKATAFIPENKIPFFNAVIGITYPSSDYEIERSAESPVNCFEYVVEGTGEIFINGIWKTVKAGDTYLLRAGELHRYRASPNSPWKKIWINYVADYIAPFLNSYNVHSGIYPGEEVRVYFEQALSLSSAEAFDSGSCHRIAELIHKIVSRISATKYRKEDTEADMIREMLNTSVYKRIDLNKLAENLHLSKSTVIRKFKKQYGITPYEFLLDAKMESAKILLRDTEMTVKQIADKLCVADEHYFSSLFLHRVGLRPKIYREQNK